jgi:hypothetical protein
MNSRRFPLSLPAEDIRASFAGYRLTSVALARPWCMFALSDSQLRAIWDAAAGLPAISAAFLLSV